MATIEVKNKFLPGDSVEVMQPGGNLQVTVDSIFDMQGEKIDAAKGSGHIVKISIPGLSTGKDCIILRNLPEGRDTRNPFNQADSLAVEVK